MECLDDIDTLCITELKRLKDRVDWAWDNAQPYSYTSYLSDWSQSDPANVIETSYDPRSDVVGIRGHCDALGEFSMTVKVSRTLTKPERKERVSKIACDAMGLVKEYRTRGEMKQHKFYLHNIRESCACDSCYKMEIYWGVGGAFAPTSELCAHESTVCDYISFGPPTDDAGPDAPGYYNGFEMV